MITQRHVEELLCVLQAHAPNVATRMACKELLNEAKQDGATLEEQEKMLVFAIADGLAYGNWLWLEAPINPKG